MADKSSLPFSIDEPFLTEEDLPGWGTAVDEAEFVESGSFHFEKGWVAGEPTLYALAELIGERIPVRLRVNMPKALEAIGEIAREEAHRMIDEGYDEWLPLAPLTVALKGSDQILYFSGQLRDSIEFTVDEKNLTVRLFSELPRIEYSEVGTSTEPPRPLLQPALEFALDKVPEEVRDALRQSFVGGDTR